MFLLGILGYIVLVCLTIVFINGYLAPLASIIGLLVAIIIVVLSLCILNGFNDFYKGIRFVSKKDCSIPENEIIRARLIFSYLAKITGMFAVIIVISALLIILNMDGNALYSISEIKVLAQKTLLVGYYCILASFLIFTPIKLKLEIIEKSKKLSGL